MSAVFQIKPGQLAGELRKRGEGAKRAVLRAARSAAMRGRRHLIAKADYMRKVDLGQYRNSFQVRNLGGQGIELVNDAPHAGIIERGARPHAVSVEGQMAIYEWVIRHFGKGGIEGRGLTRASARKREKQHGIDPKAWQITQAIVFKIRKYGQAPTYLIRDELPQLQDFWVREAEAELAKYSGKKA